MMTTLNKNNPYKLAKQYRNLKLDDTLHLNGKTIMNYMNEVYGIKFQTYKQYEKSSNFKRNATIDFNTDEAIVIRNPETEIIQVFYNQDKLLARKLWSICHEIGHILQGHIFIDLKNATVEQKQSLENEANVFAREVLAPSDFVATIATGLNKNPNIIDFYFVYNVIFKLSKEASFHSANYMKKFFYPYVALDCNFVNLQQEVLTEVITKYKTTLPYHFFHDYYAKEFDTIKRYVKRERYGLFEPTKRNFKAQNSFI